MMNYYTEIEPLVTAYVIDSTKVSYQRRGSVPYEQNHASISNFIRKDFFGELSELLLIMIERHEHKSKTCNEVIDSQHEEVALTYYSIKKNNPNSQLLVTARFLNKTGYKLFDQWTNISQR